MEEVITGREMYEAIEILKKIGNNTKLYLFDYMTVDGILDNYSCEQIVLALRRWKKEIHVGDVVKFMAEKSRYGIVFQTYMDENMFVVLDSEGKTWIRYYYQLEKTEKHYNLQEILDCLKSLEEG